MRLGSVILAGGRSRRMGRPKESLPFAGSTLLARTVETLLSCTAPVVVVARDAAQTLPGFSPDARLVHDVAVDQGPLTGMMTGFLALGDDCDAVFVCGCDAPFLSARSVEWLAAQLADDDVVMARIDGHLQPLGAIYRVGVLAAARQLLDEDIHTLRTLAERCRTRILSEADVDAFDPSRKFMQNINSPEDYEAAIARFESGQ